MTQQITDRELLPRPCQFYVPGSICKAGFPLSLSSACTGRTCLCCGRPNDILPPCQDEDIDPRWLNDDGSPRHQPRSR